MTTIEKKPTRSVASEVGPLPTAPEIDLPESIDYRVKRKLPGAPLHTEQLEHERFGIPTALAVFASDNLSSSAYATEEILRVLIPAIGIFAFSLVVPITVAMLAVLFLLILSYRETIKEYPTAGGAYVVTRDNFGILPAQVAGVSLLIDYVLTVAVSVAAGTAALTSAVPSLASYNMVIALAFIGVIAYGNLRGVRESGKVFAVPTYLFMATMAALLITGVVRVFGGGLDHAVLESEGQIPFGTGGAMDGLFYGATLYVVLHAFASGGAAVTGVEAISNGVTAFRRPEWRNARKTLVIMGSALGVMFLGLSYLATQVHPIPYEEGTPTVISQIGKAVFGGGVTGQTMFLVLQIATMLILVLAANTSFADFPRLASFQAGDSFMPKQLTKRGHRLVYSNGIIALAASAAALVFITGAQVDRLIPLYAVGVFTGFTMSQSGMARHHVRHKQAGWRRGLVVNGVGAVISLVVALVILITKFTHGAWAICVAIPLMVWMLVRLHRQYEAERVELEHDVHAAAEAPVFRKHTVLLLVDELDRAAARGIQYARSLLPDEMRAVHAAIDLTAAERLVDQWLQLGLRNFPLELVDCPDRRVDRAVLEVVAEALSDNRTEVTVLVPRLEHRRRWHRLLHDRTAGEIARAVARLDHATVTFVPYQLGQANSREVVR